MGDDDGRARKHGHEIFYVLGMAVEGSRHKLVDEDVLDAIRSGREVSMIRSNVSRSFLDRVATKRTNCILSSQSRAGSFRPSTMHRDRTRE